MSDAFICNAIRTSIGRYQLHKTNGKYALYTMYIGVGQGIAIVIERV